MDQAYLQRVLCLFLSISLLPILHVYKLLCEITTGHVIRTYFEFLLMNNGCKRYATVTDMDEAAVRFLAEMVSTY